MSRSWIALALLCVSLPVAAQTTDALTLQDALRLARAHNGQIRSAFFELRSSLSQRTSAFGAFLPSVTPGLTYETGRTKFLTGTSAGSTVRNQDSASFVDIRLPLLDNGARALRLDSARKSYDAQRADTVNTLRQTLFTVHQRFYNALRAQQLLRVQQSQLNRTRTILDQTQTRVEVGDEAKVRILQAKADALNAEVSVLDAENTANTNLTTLRAAIGLDNSAKLPSLALGSDYEAPEVGSLDKVMSEGLDRRADLVARRRQVDAAKAQYRLAKMDSMVSLSLDATYRKQFGQSPFDRSLIQLNASIPLFDGFQSREAARIREFTVQSQTALLIQAERDARAEIESAFLEYQQNIKRRRAADAAFQAASENFTAAQEAQKLGAGNLIDVLTAQLSLVTAEVNQTQALYDLLISEVRLKLVTGQQIPGEES